MIEPRRATIPVTINVPWEIADLIVQYGPAVIEAFRSAVSARQVVVASDAEAKEQTDRACDDQRAAWQALVEEVWSEIQRRANHPSQRKVIIKQIAAERGMSHVDLERLVRVYAKHRIVKRK